MIEGEYRRETRQSLTTPVSVRVDGWEHYVQVYADDISSGGLFIRMVRPPAVGTAMSVRIPMPGGYVLELAAEVAHVVAPEQQLISGKRPGAGIRFVGPTAEQKAQLAALSSEPTGPPSEPTPAPKAEEPSALVANLRAQLAEFKELDFYKVLELPADSTPADARASFLKMVRKWHPDQFGLDSREARTLAAEIFIVIKKAYETLNNPAKNKAYRARVAPSPESSADKSTDKTKDDTKDDTWVVSRDESAASAPHDSASPVAGRPQETSHNNRDIILGDTYMKSGKLDLARAAFGRALARDQENVGIRRRYTWVCAHEAIQAGDHDAAVATLTEAVARDPKFTQAIDLLREIRIKQRQAPRKGLSKFFGNR